MAKQTKEVKKPIKATKVTKVETPVKKGKLSLLDTTPPEDIIYTDEEAGIMPFFLIEDDWGIACDQYCYKLVNKKQASKTGKEENGEDPEKVYSYYRWDDIKYASDEVGILDCYVDVKKKLKYAQYIKEKDIQAIINVNLEIKAIIEKAFSVDIITKQTEEVCDIFEVSQKLKSKIDKVKENLHEVVDVKNKTIQEIKAVKMSFMERERPKTHRIKEEE